MYVCVHYLECINEMIKIGVMIEGSRHYNDLKVKNKNFIVHIIFDCGNKIKLRCAFKDYRVVLDVSSP